MIVIYPQFNGDRCQRVVEIGKMRKDGRLTLMGDREQWRKQYANNGESDYYVQCRRYGNERLYPYDEAMIDDIKRERAKTVDRMKLNDVGEKLQHIRDRDEGAKLWEKLPQEFKDLIA